MSSVSLHDLAPHHPDESGEIMSLRYVGRQPIFDGSQRVFAYELLFRNSMVNRFCGDTSDATRKMIDNILVLGRESLVGGQLAFVNFNREALVDRLPLLLPAESTVVEVLETVEVDDDVEAACRELKRMGYRIALDDFLPNATSDRLLEIADFIKMDFRAFSAAELGAIQDRLRGTRAALLAEKVETEEEFRFAAREGYGFFQGYFFAKPTVLKSRVLPPNQMAYLQILSMLGRDQPDAEAIGRLVQTEASLCLRVLRMVNSAAMGIRGEVQSIRHAVLLLGMDQMRRMVTVAMATSLGAQTSARCELILLALKRARFCKLMANFTQQMRGEQYIIGLVSVFDAILQIPMADVLGMLPLRAEARAALRGEEGAAAEPLRLVEAYERGLWEKCRAVCERLRLSDATVYEQYVIAQRWAAQEMETAGLSPGTMAR